jgi:hypothetical protein
VVLQTEMHPLRTCSLACSSVKPRYLNISCWVALSWIRIDPLLFHFHLIPCRRHSHVLFRLLLINACLLAWVKWWCMAW